MEYTYYPGCSIKTSAKGYEESLLYVFKALDLTLNEIEDWNCCGATSYMSTKETISLVISARNLAKAEKKSSREIVSPCSACYTILYKTNYIMKNNFIMREKVNQALRQDDLKYNMSLDVRHPLEVLVNDVGIETISAKATKSLTGHLFLLN
jgi:heterodisulfide reductase subunit B